MWRQASVQPSEVDAGSSFEIQTIPGTAFQSIPHMPLAWREKWSQEPNVLTAILCSRSCGCLHSLKQQQQKKQITGDYFRPLGQLWRNAWGKTTLGVRLSLKLVQPPRTCGVSLHITVAPLWHWKDWVYRFLFWRWQSRHTLEPF